MYTYREFRPTSFDQHINISDDREDWIVFPCSHNRDSNCLDESNFQCGLKMLGGESDDVEVYKFFHWGNGYFEIILVKPNTYAASIAANIEKKLEDYPVLDENDFCEREAEEEAINDA